MQMPEGSRLIKTVTVGSTAYGLATATSDIDTLGVYIVPTELLLGLDGHKHADNSIVTNDPDRTLHEVGKFVHLALKCNPTVLELIFAELIQEENADFSAPMEFAGRAAIHEKGVRAAYGGYAKQQAERLVRRTDEGRKGSDPDLSNRTAKHGRHCFRLMIQAEQLLTTGEITLDVSQHRDEIFSMGRLAEMNPKAFYAAFEKRNAHLNSLETVLPEEPDRRMVNHYLLTMRRRADTTLLGFDPTTQSGMLP